MSSPAGPPLPPSLPASPPQEPGRPVAPSFLRLGFKRRAEAQTGDTTAADLGGTETSAGRRPRRDGDLGRMGTSAGRGSRRNGGPQLDISEGAAWQRDSWRPSWSSLVQWFSTVQQLSGVCEMFRTTGSECRRSCGSWTPGDSGMSIAQLSDCCSGNARCVLSIHVKEIIFTRAEACVST